MGEEILVGNASVWDWDGTGMKIPEEIPGIKIPVGFLG